MNKKKVLLGVAIGAAVGTALGALIAPAKGSVTRKKISRKSAEVTKDAKKKIGQYSDAVMEEYNTIKKGAKNLVQKGKKKSVALTGKKLGK